MTTPLRRPTGNEAGDRFQYDVQRQLEQLGGSAAARSTSREGIVLKAAVPKALGPGKGAVVIAQSGPAAIYVVNARGQLTIESDADVTVSVMVL